VHAGQGPDGGYRVHVITPFTVEDAPPDFVEDTESEPDHG